MSWNDVRISKIYCGDEIKWDKMTWDTVRGLSECGEELRQITWDWIRVNKKLEGGQNVVRRRDDVK